MVTLTQTIAVLGLFLLSPAQAATPLTVQEVLADFDIDTKNAQLRNGFLVSETADALVLPVSKTPTELSFFTLSVLTTHQNKADASSTKC
jgi:hypothetical protein